MNLIPLKGFYSWNYGYLKGRISGISWCCTQSNPVRPQKRVLFFKWLQKRTSEEVSREAMTPGVMSEVPDEGLTAGFEDGGRGPPAESGLWN